MPKVPWRNLDGIRLSWGLGMNIAIEYVSHRHQKQTVLSKNKKNKIEEKKKEKKAPFVSLP